MRQPGRRATTRLHRRSVASRLAGCAAGILVGWGVSGPGAVANAQSSATPGYELRLSPESREILHRATQEGRVAAPERIAASVRRFAEAPDATVILENFEDPEELGFHGTCFHARIEAGEASAATGLYSCRAADGRVFGLIRGRNPDPDLPPVVTEAQAEEIARQFLLRKYPEFAARRWAQDYRWSHDNAGEFELNWTQVLNAHGTRAIHDLRVAVEKSTGRVVSYSCPPDRATGPLVPGITLAQAKALGSEFAAFDPAKIPFSPTYPQLSEDPRTGKQSLWWVLHQVVQLGEGSWADCVVRVEALTGAEIVPPAHQPGASAGTTRPEVGDEQAFLCERNCTWAFSR